MEGEAAMMMMSEEAWMKMSEEDSYRAMAEEGVGGSFDENLPMCRSEMTKRVGEMERAMESPLHKRDYPYLFSQLDWAEGLEDSTFNVIKHMAGDRDCCRRGAVHFAAKEPALAETLRRKAAWCDAARKEAVEIDAGARRLRGMCLKMLADAEEEDIVYVAAAECLVQVATDAASDRDSIPVYPYAEVADEVYATVAAGARDPGVKRYMEGFAERAWRLRRGAVDFEGEDAVKLTERAATVEAMCADTETFVQKMVSSPYWEMWEILIGREAALEAQTPTDTTPLLCTLERSDGHDADDEPAKKRRKTVCS